MPGKSQLGLRERKKEAVRNRILEVAREKFRERGFAMTSMDEIAEEVEISRQSLFNYMVSKEAIVIALIEDLIVDNLGDWTEPDAPLYHDARDVIAPLLDRRLDAMAEHRWLLELAAEHTHYFNPGRRSFMHPVLASNFAARTQRIASVQDEGKIRADIPPDAISWAYEALRDVTMQRWLADPDSTSADLHEGFEHFNRILLSGLAADAAPREPAPRRRTKTSK